MGGLLFKIYNIYYSTQYRELANIFYDSFSLSAENKNVKEKINEMVGEITYEQADHGGFSEH